MRIHVFPCSFPFLSASFGKHKTLVNTQKRGNRSACIQVLSLLLPLSSLFNSPKEKQKMAQKDNLSPHSPNTSLDHHSRLQNAPSQQSQTTSPVSQRRTPIRHCAHPSSLPSRNLQSNNKPPPPLPLPLTTNKTPRASTKLPSSTPADQASAAAAAVLVTAAVPARAGVGVRR